MFHNGSTCHRSKRVWSLAKGPQELDKGVDTGSKWAFCINHKRLKAMASPGKKKSTCVIIVLHENSCLRISLGSWVGFDNGRVTDFGCCLSPSSDCRIDLGLRNPKP